MMYNYNQIHFKKYLNILKDRITEIKYYNRLKFRFSVIIHKGCATLQSEPFSAVHMLCAEKDKIKDKAKRDKRGSARSVRGRKWQNPGAKYKVYFTALRSY